ncbi:MAG: hypothetical protein Q9161_008519 [Pseudevernia consocians]
MAATLLLPIYVQAVAFSVDTFEGIAVGKPMNLSWWGDKNSCSQPVTIKLMQGPPEALEPVVTIASNVAGDSYTWTPTTIAAGTYVLSITQGTETNYSPQFAVANTFTPNTPTPAPGPAVTKPSTKATAGTAPTPATPPGVTGHSFSPAAIAAYYPPAGYNNGSKSKCTSDATGSSTSAPFPCYSSVQPITGHFPSSKGGVGKMDVAIGAAVMGMTFAVMVLL